jgi:hypothetical protein
VNQDLSAALDAYTELERGGRVGGGGGGGEVACVQRWVGFSARQMHLPARRARESPMAMGLMPLSGFAKATTRDSPSMA